MKFIFVTFPCRRSGCGKACMRGICLPVEFYMRVRVDGRMSSPSLAFRETAHLLAFLFASFSNAYENNI